MLLTTLTEIFEFKNLSTLSYHPCQQNTIMYIWKLLSGLSWIFITMLIRLGLQGTQRYSHQQRADGDIIHKGPSCRCGAEGTEPIWDTSG